MKVSVVICTYNGDKYLDDQLNSILAQTRSPDELLVCDDTSGDNTLRILNTFKSIAPFPVRIISNKRNLGSTANFAQAITKSSGDIIFLADQDDVWFPHKIESMVKVFKENPEVGMVFSDAIVTDEHLNPYPKTLWHYFEFDQHVRDLVQQGQLWTILGWNSYVTGATMAFRSNIRKNLNPFPRGWVHDEWITFVSDLVSRIEIVSEPLMYYRRHSAQQIGVKIHERSLFVKLRLAIFPDGHYRKCDFRVQRIGSVMKHIREIKGDLRNSRILPELEDRLEHWQNRLSLSTSIFKRIRIINEEFMRGRYKKYSGSNSMVVKDMCDL